MTQQFFFAQKAFIARNNQLLMVRKAPDDPHHPGKWEVPGGRMEFGEGVDDHLRREVFEEVGIEVMPLDPFHIWQCRLSRSGKDGLVTDVQIVAVARLCKPVTMELSDKHRIEGDCLDEIKWVPFKEISTYALIPDMIPVMEAFRTRMQKDWA